MKKIFLYEIDNPGTCREKTGHFLTPPELVNNDQIPKEQLVGTEQHLNGYHGKWHIEVIQCHVPIHKQNNPFEIEVYFIGPYGRWARPAYVYLVLEE